MRRGRNRGRFPASSTARGHGPAARRHRDPARPGAGQDGGRRHRHRPRRAPGDRRLAQGVGRHAAGGSPGAGGSRVQRQLDATAAHRPLRGAGAHTGQEDEDRVLDGRADAREPAWRPSHHRRAPLVPRGGEAPVDLRREPPGRGPSGRPHPRLVRPDGGEDGPDLVGPSQPPQHPRAERDRQAVPASLRAGRGHHVPGGGLRPGRTAGDRPPVGRPGPHRRHDLRCGRAPYGGRGRLRRHARGSDAHPARVLQDGLLRPRLRHGGLRPEPAPRRRQSRRRRPSWRATSARSRA